MKLIKQLPHRLALLTLTALFAAFAQIAATTAFENDSQINTIKEAGFFSTNEIAIPQPAPLVTDTAMSSALDCLDEILTINGEGMPKPPATFKAGHVTPRQFDAQITKVENGIKVKMPQATRVPSPIVVDGKVYSSGGFGSKSYYCFNAETGETIWAVDLDDDGPSTAAYQDGIIVFNTESCTIFALDAQTGKQIWSYWLGDPLMTTPTIANGRVYTTYPAYYDQSKLPKDVTLRPNHPLVCFDLKTGAIQWQKWLDGDILNRAVPDGDALYVTTFPGTLYKINQKTGEFLAAKKMRATSAPTIEDGKIYVSRRTESAGEAVSEGIALLKSDKLEYVKHYNEQEAPYLDRKVQDRSRMKTKSMEYDAGNGFAGGAPASAGATKASDNIGQSNVSSLQAFRGAEVLRHDNRNYNTMGNKVVCTDEETEEVLWEMTVDGDMHAEGGFLAAPPTPVGEDILITTLDGTVTLLDPKTGKDKKSYKVNSSIREQATYANGRAYIPTTNGEVIFLNLE